MSEYKTQPLLQTFLNHLTSLPQDRIQEIRIGWEQMIGLEDGIEGTKTSILPKLTILMKD